MASRTRNRYLFCPIERIITGLAACVMASALMADRVEAAEPATVAVVLTTHESYRQAASALEKTLSEAGHRCMLIELPTDTQMPSTDSEGEPGSDDSPTPPKQGSASETSPTAKPEPMSSQADMALKRLAQAKPAIIVTVGATTTSLVLENIPDTPVVFCVVPNSLDMPFMNPENPNLKRLAGVTTDIAPSQRIDWIKKTAPQAANIGVPCSPRSKRTAEAIKSKARTQGITVSVIESNRDEFPKTIEELNSRGCDGVLMIPDARIYNSATVQRLLLWGIRNKKPVWTFSSKIVKAGAFAGQYSDSQSIGRQTAELVKKVLNGTEVAKIGLQYPENIDRAVNARTADMIGISLSPPIENSVTTIFGREK